MINAHCCSFLTGVNWHGNLRYGPNLIWSRLGSRLKTVGHTYWPLNSSEINILKDLLNHCMESRSRTKKDNHNQTIFFQWYVWYYIFQWYTYNGKFHSLKFNNSQTPKSAASCTKKPSHMQRSLFCRQCSSLTLLQVTHRSVLETNTFWRSGGQSPKEEAWSVPQ